MLRIKISKKFKKNIYKLSAFIAAVIIGLTASIPAQAAKGPDYHAMAEERKNLPIQSNSYENWPDGPAVSAQSAIVMDVNSGAVLYAKNIDEKLYPASTTKILTCLLAVENAAMDEEVTFSYDAVFGVPRDGSNMGIDVGEILPMEDCLYGILVGSANEVASAVGEHVGGDTETFLQMMNDKAKELGCKNTNFMNANGLHDENHYTTAYDLALIARAFFSNDFLANIANTPRVHFTPTDTQPDDFYLNNKNKLVSGEIKYQYYMGGKTGYTNDARQTLVSCAEKDGMRLVCVVMKEETPDQFNDTVTLFNYGFSNFKKINVSSIETKYTIENTGFYQTGQDIFGSSKSILQLDNKSYIVVPTAAEFADVESTISYENLLPNQVAAIDYTYNDIFVGRVAVNLAANTEVYDFSESTPTQNDVTIVNVKAIILWILAIAILLCLGLFLAKYINHYHLGGKKGRMAKRRRRRTAQRTVSPYRNFNFDDIDLRR